MAVSTGNRGKSLVLHIEDLCKHSAGCAELVGIEIPVTAFLALPVLVLHSMSALWSEDFHQSILAGPEAEIRTFTIQLRLRRSSRLSGHYR